MQSNTELKRRYITIQGNVQGVFFRKNVKEKADQLGISGWVRNTPNGDVVIVAEGPSPALDDFLRYCRRGPTFAKVTSLETHDGEFEGEFDSFFVKS
ncbi:acylphosphatase [Candidatus Woesearchaeota archaeon]|nr:acylphosphatase [Candidatus Woesearchaeota archaeon]